MDYFHYCNVEDSDEEQDVAQGEEKKQSSLHGPAQNLGETSYAAAIELGKKEPPCRGHPNLDEAYLKFVKEQHVTMCEYVKNNPKHFCETCGLNLKYTQYLAASYQYEALILSEDDCKICESPEGKICDVDKHQEYHRETCLK
jgi:hypothetical protein